MPARPNAGSNNRFYWLPRPLRQHLAAIAEAEHMTARALLVVAVRELVTAYHSAQTPEPAARPRPDAELETVWTPHRDADAE